MKSVLAAEFAVLIKLYSVRIILFVFLRVVISLLALSAHQSDLNSCIISHFFGTSIFKIFDRIILTEGNDLCTSLTEQRATVPFGYGAYRCATKKACPQRYTHYTTFGGSCQ
jgi:hypothetical protein